MLHDISLHNVVKISVRSKTIKSSERCGKFESDLLIQKLYFTDSDGQQFEITAFMDDSMDKHAIIEFDDLGQE